MTNMNIAAIRKALYEKGFNTLASAFKEGDDKLAEETAEKILQETGIAIEDVADNKLSESDWVALKQFELTQESDLIDRHNKADFTETALKQTLAADADRQNARNAQAERERSDDLFIKRFPYYYAFLITVLTFAFIFYALDITIKGGEDLPRPTVHIINTVTGFLLGVSLSAIVQYFFGSSAGSKQKAEHISKIFENTDGHVHGKQISSQTKKGGV